MDMRKREEGFNRYYMINNYNLFFSPLEQFKIEWYFRAYNNLIDLTVSNITMYLIISYLIIKGLNYIMTNDWSDWNSKELREEKIWKKLVCDIVNKEKIKEISKDYINKKINNNEIIEIEKKGKNKIIGNKYKNLFINILDLYLNQILILIGNKGISYIPYITTLFLLLLVNNLIGLIPYSYTITSQIILALFLSLSLWFSYTLIGIETHKFNYIKILLPSGVPSLLLPLIFVIEIISYLSRIISLSVRLACNMLAGHTLIAIVSSFGTNLFNINFLLAFFPLIFLFLFFLLEFGVAIIQASVFIILTCTYLKDSLYLH